MRTEVLRLRHISKSINGNPILADINCHIFTGEKMGIIGLHDTGKAVLADIISGRVRPDDGQMESCDEAISFGSVNDAQGSGIYHISLKAQLIRKMTVTENLFVVQGRNMRRLLLTPRRHAAATRLVLDRFHLDISPTSPVEALTIEEQRMIELIKITIQNPRLIIIDSAVEDAFRSERLEQLIGQIVGLGVSILIIGNKVSPFISRCDRLYVLRSGVLSKPLAGASATGAVLQRLLVGAPAPTGLPAPAGPDVPGAGEDIVLEAQGLRLNGMREAAAFTVAKGEVVALLPASPCEYSRLPEDFFGRGSPAGKSLLLGGAQVGHGGVTRAIKAGIAIIPGDAEHMGAFKKIPVYENLALMVLGRLARPFGAINRRKAMYLARQAATELDLNVPRMRAESRYSGIPKSTAYKIVIGRWMLYRPSLYLFFDPFADTDEQSAREMVGILKKLAATGAAVLLVTNNPYRLEEVCTRQLHY